MPDRRRHGGPHPEDAELFGEHAVSVLRAAVADLSWLLTRGYAEVAALEVVGNRYQLAQRQRVAVRRCACTDAQRVCRARARRDLASLRGARLAVDGFNVLTTIEAALAGGVLLRGRDGVVRDMASMHGTWRRVAETAPAVDAMFAEIAACAPAGVEIVLDRQVANSGRLAGMLRVAAATVALPCAVALAGAADAALLATGVPVATADRAILDRAAHWVDLAGAVLRRLPGTPWLLDLGGERQDRAGGAADAPPTGDAAAPPLA